MTYTRAKGENQFYSTDLSMLHLGWDTLYNPGKWLGMNAGRQHSREEIFPRKHSDRDFGCVRKYIILHSLKLKFPPSRPILLLIPIPVALLLHMLEHCSPTT
jgi:hypothetical protein